MFDPTHDPTAKRAWNALLALCTVHGTRAYKPENIGRLKYAMTMAVDLAGAKADQTTREVAAPQATWRALDAMAGTNAAAGAHFNARGVGLGVWAHARTRTPIEPESMRAYEIAVARGALDHRGTVGQNVSNALWGYAKLGAAPSRDVVTQGFPSPWAKFEEAVVRLLPTMKPQEVANTMYAYALWGRRRRTKRGPRWKRKPSLEHPDATNRVTLTSRTSSGSVADASGPACSARRRSRTCGGRTRRLSAGRAR